MSPLPVLLAVLSVPVTLWAQPQDPPQDAPQDEVAVRVAQLRRDLVQPGPEARQAREVALDSLLLMLDARAHRAVCDVFSLPPSEAPEQVRLTILSKLEARWHLPMDPVFGEPNPARATLHELYANTVLNAFQGDEPIAAEGELERVQRAVWTCFRALAPIDRRRLFAKLVETNDAERRRRALWGIAGCRDLGLAPLIADSLDETGAVGAAARAALSTLTFVERPFRSQREFDEWYAANTLLYVDLAERAARERTLAAASHVQLLEAELVGALASSENVDWQRIATLLAGAPSPEAMRLYLRRLDEVLATRGQLGGNAAEARLELVRLLQQGLDSGIDPIEYGLRLQVLARLVVVGEAGAEPVIQRLVDATMHADAGVRLAGVRGLGLHYSPAIRAVVVDAGRAARASGNAELLRESLRCLAQRDWVAPSHDEAAIVPWLDLLNAVLTPDALGVEFQSQAIEVLVQQTAEKTRLDDAFRLLREAAGSARGLSPLVRKQALARLRLFAESERADEYVEFVASLLPDAVPEVREAAARMLRELPAGNRKQREAWTTTVVTAVGARLAVETHEAPMRAALDCLMRLAGEAEDSTNVIGKFATAVEAYLARPAAEQKAFQRQCLVDGLGRLGGVQGRELAQWLRAADSLARLEDRQALRFVLERQHVASLAGGNGDEFVAVWRLVLQAGLLAPPGRRFGELRSEAEEIRLAFRELERLGQPAVEPAMVALRVCVLDALGRHDEVLAIGVPALSDKTRPLPAERRDAVVLAVARGQLDKGALDAAQGLLEPLEDNDPGVLALSVAIAERRLEQGQFEHAETLMARVMAATPPTDPEFAIRFLLATEAHYRRAPAEHATATAAALREQQGVFDLESTPTAVKQRYAALVAEIAGREGD